MSYRGFEYARGNKFSVKVVIAENDSMSFHDIKMPDEVPAHIKELFLEEAERAVIKKLEAGETHGSIIHTSE